MSGNAGQLVLVIEFAFESKFGRSSFLSTDITEWLVTREFC
jgi:hypothetical protein